MERNEDMLFTVKQELLNPVQVPSPAAFPLSKIDTWRTPPLNPSYPYSLDLQRSLSGKQLLLTQTPYPLSLIHEHYLNGYISYQKALTQKENGYKCNRCGSDSPFYFASFPCSRCHQECYYCRACIVMGKVSECTPFINWEGPASSVLPKSSVMNWKGMLSKAQERASNELIQAIRKDEELLIWAVCGAGKTEILFKGIESALNSGKKVCIATPRTDVVIELKPRIQSAFPNMSVLAMYGGSEDRFHESSLIISTTHQLLHYYQAFDVLIIDEVDAFPYSTEPMLHYAVAKAAKHAASKIYLTATPNESLKKDVEQGKKQVVKIPARYHRMLIPVPRFEWCGNWKKKMKTDTLPANVEKWLKKRINEGKQCFIFVPQIKWIAPITDMIRKLTEKVDGVHAEDSQRKEKVMKFREGQLVILVTTTILERGVTVPNIDVAVLGAEETIFTESALVQISGRVGRSAQFPTGDVVFFHYGQSLSMRKAKEHIEYMNALAYKEGLVDR